jgi:transposase
VLDAIRVPRPSGQGRPRQRPDHLVGDKAYSYRAVGGCCAAVASHTPSPSGPTSAPVVPAGQAGRWGSIVRYRGRNVVERCFNRLKQFRAVATRFEKRAVNCRAMVVIASLLIWLDG